MIIPKNGLLKGKNKKAIRNIAVNKAKPPARGTTPVCVCAGWCRNRLLSNSLKYCAKRMTKYEQTKAVIPASKKGLINNVLIN